MVIPKSVIAPLKAKTKAWSSKARGQGLELQGQRSRPGAPRPEVKAWSSKARGQGLELQGQRSRPGAMRPEVPREVKAIKIWPRLHHWC